MSLGIFKQLESPLDITTSTIIKRIVSNHEAYQVSSLTLCSKNRNITAVIVFSTPNHSGFKLLSKEEEMN